DRLRHPARRRGGRRAHGDVRGGGRAAGAQPSCLQPRDLCLGRGARGAVAQGQEARPLRHEGRAGALVTALQQGWARVGRRLKILEPATFTADQWSLLERLRANFNDRIAHTYLPLPIARFRDAASKTIFEQAKQFDGVQTVYVDDRWRIADTMAN